MAVIFRWEDSPALKHHCGFCERPLNHPGTKTSCLGDHCEPCARYHQALFMRRRSHQCMACLGLDEAHRKKHAEIAEALRVLYELCGWYGPIMTCVISGKEGADGERGTDRGASTPEHHEGDKEDAYGKADRPRAKRRDRKLAKNLAKAANRPRVITGLEIDYIDKVLHPAQDNSDSFGPDSAEELEEIERNLRYNASVYNSGTKSLVLRSFTRIPDSDINFDSEMERILDALGLAKLARKNARNKGLLGKELRTFDENLVILKEKMVDDLVWVKKEDMETRMRKAGFLRWANRAGYHLLEQRFADWHHDTGERIVTLDTSEHQNGNRRELHADATGKDMTRRLASAENASPERPKPAWKEVLSGVDRDLSQDPATPDMRHICSKGKLVSPAAPVPSSLKKASPNPTPVPPIHFKILNVVPPKKPTPKKESMSLIGWNTVLKGGKVMLPSTPPVLADISSTNQNSSTPVTSRASSLGAAGSSCSFPSSPTATTTPSSVTRTASTSAVKKPSGNQFPVDAQLPTPVRKHAELLPALHIPLSPSKRRRSASPAEDVGPLQSPPPVSNKKAKKAKREAGRKQRRQVEQKAGLAKDTSLFPDVELCTTEMLHTPDDKVKSPVIISVANDAKVVSKGKETKCTEKPPQTPNVSASSTDSDHDSEEMPCQSELEDSSTTTSPDPKITPGGKIPSPRPVCFPTQNFGDNFQAQLLRDLRKGRERINKYDIAVYHRPQSLSDRPTFPGTCKETKWLEFEQQLEVDDLSSPGLSHFECPFLGHNQKDCPFHRSDTSWSPFDDKVFITIPSSKSLSSGPFNRLRGEKLQIFFNRFEELRGRIMLVDQRMFDYLAAGPGGEHPPPISLVHERSEYLAGYTSGRLMKQEQDFNTLVISNNAASTQFTDPQLMAMHKQLEHPAAAMICYCEGPVPSDEDWDDDVIVCAHKDCKIGSFHRVCVYEMSPDTLSTWYCAECQIKMTKSAEELSKELGFEVEDKSSQPSKALKDWLLKGYECPCKSAHC